VLDVDVGPQTTRVAAAELKVEGRTAPLRVTVSVGVAQMDPEGDVEAAFRAADVALYEAKHAGRDRVVLQREHDAASGA